MKITIHRRLNFRRPNLLWLPAILIAGSLALPLIYLGVRTFEATPQVWELIFRPRTWELIQNTLILIVTVTLASTVISLPLAWLTSCTDLPLRHMWSVLAVVPLVIPSFVGAYAFVATLGPRGMLQQVLEGPFGVTQLPDIYGFPGAFVVITLFTYPFLFLNLKAAFSAMDPALEDISRSLGYNRWYTFWRITLPQLRPALAAGGLLVALYTLSDFGAVAMLQYDTFTRAIYLQYQAAFDRTYAAALALILALLSIVILYGEIWMRAKSARYYRTDSGARRTPSLVTLGGWRWPALFFSGGVVFFALGVPSISISYWLVRGMAAGETLRILWVPLWNSFSISALAALVICIAAGPIAMLSVRSPGWLSSILERLTYIGYALPGIAIALSLVFFGAGYALFLYQTVTLLVFGYMVQFLPLAGGAIRASLLRINPRIEEAARSLGRNNTAVLSTITLPLVRPGVLSGMAIVFLMTMKELPMTLLLGPTGFQTLATVLWGAMEEAFFARAAVPALILVLISSMSLVGMVSQMNR